jgi:hypothetical protein
MTDDVSEIPAEPGLTTFAEAWTWRTPLATVAFEAGAPVDLERLTPYGDIYSAAKDRAQCGAE